MTPINQAALLFLPVREHVDRFMLSERQVLVVRDRDVVVAQALAALRLLAGHVQLSAEYDQSDSALPAPVTITEDICVDETEWMLIYPLFLLYLERETCLQLEASRVMGVEPFGRSSSEVSADIRDYESQLGYKAFSQPYLTLT